MAILLKRKRNPILLFSIIFLLMAITLYFIGWHLWYLLLFFSSLATFSYFAIPHWLVISDKENIFFSKPFKWQHPDKLDVKEINKIFVSDQEILKDKVRCMSFSFRSNVGALKRNKNLVVNEKLNIVSIPEIMIIGLLRDNIININHILDLNHERKIDEARLFDEIL